MTTCGRGHVIFPFLGDHEINPRINGIESVEGKSRVAGAHGSEKWHKATSEMSTSFMDGGKEEVDDANEGDDWREEQMGNRRGYGGEDAEHRQRFEGWDDFSGSMGIFKCGEDRMVDSSVKELEIVDFVGGRA